jgi:DNA ligase-1
MSNHIGPSYVPSGDLGIGSQILTAALKSATGLSHAALRTLNNRLGDAGDVAFEAKVRLAFLLCSKNSRIACSRRRMLTRA